MRELSASEAATLHAQSSVRLLDVREPWEHELCMSPAPCTSHG